jgi:2-polyprenyl-3-methyl-5-hydroxy-6-metoxy-1,4-benzoquinol methylase
VGATHWQRLWEGRDHHAVTWFQAVPRCSLDLITEVAPGPDRRIVDVGGGASTLVDHLLDRGYRALTVVDVAEAALVRARERLGERASSVDWVAADVRQLRLGYPVELWHDRAVFHFLVEAEDRDAYVQRLREHVVPGGCAVLATFALTGPETCSGLPVQRYSASGLAAELGAGFALGRSMAEAHRTPDGRQQDFVYVLLQRRG